MTRHWWQLRRRYPGPRARSLIVWTWIAWSIWLGLRIVYRYFGRGREHIPATGPIIYAANHQSHFDPLIAGVLIRDRPFTAMARKSLFFFPLSLLMRAPGAIPIRRGESDRGAIRDLLKQLELGRCVFMFPEGTRSPDGSLGRFRNGVALLARRSGVPVVPIAIEGAHELWPRSRRLPHLLGRRTCSAAGEPIPASAFETDEGLEQLRCSIETMRLELRAELRRRSDGRYPPAGPGDLAYWEVSTPPPACSRSPRP